MKKCNLTLNEDDKRIIARGIGSCYNIIINAILNFPFNRATYGFCGFNLHFFT